MKEMTPNVWAGILILLMLFALVMFRRGFRGLVIELGE